MRRLVWTMVAMLLVHTAWALAPAEVLVVYNSRVRDSKKLADYYVAKRRVPKDNVLAVRAGTRERMPRKEYLTEIEQPVKAWLDAGDRRKRIRCIVLMRGVPLMVNHVPGGELTRASKAANSAYKVAVSARNRLAAQKRVIEAQRRKTAADRRELIALDRKIAEADREVAARDADYKSARAALDRKIKDTNASVDSELAVMDFENHPLQRWMPNMLHYRTWSRPNRRGLPKTFMVCRLDAAKASQVRRIIDDSIAVEKAGLKGIAYFDSQDLARTRADTRGGIIAYDVAIQRAAALVEDTTMKTVHDRNKAVFAPGTCPDAALYCGWYRLKKYVPAFKWNRGAVGYHIASWEAMTLRDGGPDVWCKRMIDEGVAATFGPVWEPFMAAFPVPEHFFAFLLTGKYTVAEAFWYTKPMNSWMLTLVADPLYTPFKANPRLSIDRMKQVLKITSTPSRAEKSPKTPEIPPNGD